jgi:hypothetical protein
MNAAQDLACQQAFAAGDLDYYRSANCTRTAANDKLIADAKRSSTMKTVLLIGGAVVGTGLLIYLSTK